MTQSGHSNACAVLILRDRVARTSAVGGPQMVVDRVIHYSDDSTSVYCVWFENDRKQEFASRLAGSKSTAHGTNSFSRR